MPPRPSTGFEDFNVPFAKPAEGDRFTRSSGSMTKRVMSERDSDFTMMQQDSFAAKTKPARKKMLSFNKRKSKEKSEVEEIRTSSDFFGKQKEGHSKAYEAEHADDFAPDFEEQPDGNQVTLLNIPTPDTGDGGLHQDEAFSPDQLAIAKAKAHVIEGIGEYVRPQVISFAKLDAAVAGEV